jgi:uncharacterized protein HemY
VQITWNEYPTFAAGVIVLIAALAIAWRAMSMVERILGLPEIRRTWFGKRKRDAPAEPPVEPPDAGG